MTVKELTVYAVAALDSEGQWLRCEDKGQERTWLFLQTHPLWVLTKTHMNRPPALSIRGISVHPYSLSLPKKNSPNLRSGYNTLLVPKSEQLEADYQV